MKKLKPFISFIFLLVAWTAAAEEYPRITPNPVILPIRRDYREFSALDLAEASFILSGLEENETRPYLDRTKALIADFNRYYEDRGSPASRYKQGELILDFLHEELFRRYDEFQTRTDVVLERGTYNCVSSAVFYAVLAKVLGLSVWTINTEDHVFCAVRTEEGEIDVETTSPYGFHPGTKHEFTDSFGKTGFTYVPPGNYSKREPGDMATLLSFILQNRIAELQKKRLYFESVGLAVDRYALLGTNSAFNLMVSEFINYAADLNKRGRYEEGIDFLRYTGTRYNTGEAFDEIYKTLTNNLIILLTDGQEFDRSTDLIGRWLEEGVISREYTRELRSLVADRRAYRAVHTEDPAGAEALLDSLYGEGELAGDRYEEFIVFLYGKQAETEGRAGNWIEAAEIMERAMDKIGPHPQLRRARDGYIGNYAVTVHNEFADLFNAGRFEEALALLEEGLSRVPGDRTLNRDLELVRDALSRN